MRSLSFVFVLMAIFGMASTSYAQGSGKAKYHCEVKKDGKTTDDASIKNRKTCKAKGGKWVKDHDHDHDHDHGHDHDHSGHSHD